jgi:hypothetical protein
MRVIFISGFAEDTFRRNEEKVEDLHFLPKPFGLKQLVAKVKEVFSGAPPRPTADALPIAKANLLPDSIYCLALARCLTRLVTVGAEEKVTN